MRKAAISLILTMVLLSLAAFAWQATYDIPWWTIDSGAETSIGGDFTVAGTIGQADAGPVLTGGQYAVTGGYWYGREGPAPPENDVYLPLVIR
jgi:hypothetical protein